MRLDKSLDSRNPWVFDAHTPYSVLMSIYQKEDPSHLLEALGSMVSQTVPPEEIVLVEDGRLSDPLYDAVDEFQSGHPGLLTVVSYEENRGLGHALASGLPKCRNEIVARMDSDDYAFPDRMEKQLGALLGEHLDMVGSQVTEFATAPDEPIAESTLPCDSKDIELIRRNAIRSGIRPWCFVRAGPCRLATTAASTCISRTGTCSTACSRMDVGRAT